MPFPKTPFVHIQSETDNFFHVPQKAFQGRFSPGACQPSGILPHLSVSAPSKIGPRRACSADFSIKRFPLCDTDNFTHLCQKLMHMKKFVLMLVPALALLSCQRSGLPEESSRMADGEIYHDMIQLGEKLDDPYTGEDSEGMVLPFQTADRQRGRGVDERPAPEGDPQGARALPYGPPYGLPHPPGGRLLSGPGDRGRRHHLAVLRGAGRLQVPGRPQV